MTKLIVSDVMNFTIKMEYLIHMVSTFIVLLRSVSKSYQLSMVKATQFTLLRSTPNCLSSVRTMLITSKIFACNLFHIPKDRHSGERIKMTAIDYSIALSYVLLYFTFTFPFFIDMVFVRTSILLPSGNVVIIFLVRIIFYFILIANFSCYIMEALNKKKIWKLITKLYDFDENVSYSD